MTIKEIKTNYTKLSLKKICDETKVCYQYVLKASKKPIENQPYDATAFNYDEVQKIFDKKGINLDNYDWSQINSEQKVFEPINKPEDFDSNPNNPTFFKIRNDNTYYVTIYTTETHIVFLPASKSEGTQPRVMNWDTFLHQSPRITNTSTSTGDDQPKG